MKIGMKIGMKRASCAQWSRFSGTSISMAQQRMSPWAMVPPRPPQAPIPSGMQSTLLFCMELEESCSAGRAELSF